MIKSNTNNHLLSRTAVAHVKHSYSTRIVLNYDMEKCTQMVYVSCLKGALG